MKTAVIYARYSCDKQTEQSIEGQLRVCQDYAKSHDILIIDTYIDQAISGTTDNRPDFQRMIKDSAKKTFELVLVYKLDRFSRDKFAATMYKHTLKQNGVKVLSAMENIPDTPEGIILESLLEGMNQYYSAELSQKVKRGMKETRLKGNFTGGHLLYGYDLKDHKIIINESQAEIVRYIYEQFSLGVYVKDIIKFLTAKGIYNNGKPFARNTVYNILKNEKYSGIYRHGGEVFENMYPQIVPTDIYENVRAKISENKYGKRSVEVVYLLRHKLKCGYCGQPISAETGTSKNGQVKRYYKCLGRKRQNGCKKSMIGKEYLENLIISAIIEQLSDQQIMNTIVANLLKIQERLTKETPILNLLAKEKRQTEKAIKNIMTAIENGVITNTTTKRLKELEERQENLERQILLERSKTAVKYTDQEIRTYYGQALNLEPQMLINYLVKEIIVYDDRIDVIYNSPIMISPDDENRQDFIFYSKTVKLNAIQNLIITLRIK